MLSERHLTLILFLHSLYILNESDDNKYNPGFRPWKLLSVALKQNQLQEIFTSSTDDDRPQYLGLNSWENFKRLESIEPIVFKNLTKSLRADDTKWREYFWPHSSSGSELIEKDVDILNDAPLGTKLGFLDKLALWICARPDKVADFLKFS